MPQRKVWNRRLSCGATHTPVVVSLQIPVISPAVSDVMMNRTFAIIEGYFRKFETHDWVVWFTVNLVPILPSFTTEMLVKVTASVNCTDYRVM